MSPFEYVLLLSLLDATPTITAAPPPTFPSRWVALRVGEDRLAEGFPRETKETGRERLFGRFLRRFKRRRGSDATPARSNPDPNHMRDWQLTVRARSALWQDPDLAAFNIYVHVRNRVVTLEGSVPSAYYRQRAGDVVRRLPGVAGVQNQLKLGMFDPVPPRPTRLPPLPDLDRPQPPDASLPSASEVKPGRHDNALVKRTGPSAIIGTPITDWSPENAEKPARISGVRPADAGDASSRLSAEVARLLNSEPAYKRVFFTIENGSIVLRGRLPSSDDLDRLTRSLRAIGGFTEIRLGEIEYGSTE